MIFPTNDIQSLLSICGEGEGEGEGGVYIYILYVLTDIYASICWVTN